MFTSAGLMGAARVRRRTEDEGRSGEMECVWSLGGGIAVSRSDEERERGGVICSLQHILWLAVLAEHEGLCLRISIWPRLPAHRRPRSCASDPRRAPSGGAGPEGRPEDRVGGSYGRHASLVRILRQLSRQTP